MGRYGKRIKRIAENNFLEIGASVLSVISLIACLFFAGRYIWNYTVTLPQTMKRIERDRNAMATRIRLNAASTVADIEGLARQSFMHDLFEALNGKEAIHIKSIDSIRSQLKEALQSRGYSDAFFIRFDGTIALATQSQFQGQSLQDPKFKESALSMSFARVAICLSTDISRYSQDSFFEKPVLYITTLIYDGLKPVGVMAIPFNFESFDVWIPSYLYKKRTDEFVLGAPQPHDIIVINNPRLADTNELMRSPYRAIAPLPLQYSVRGKEGSGRALDYRNQQVFAAWEYIPLVNWGIVVKQDVKDLLSTFSTTRNLLLISLICALICAFFMAFFYYHEIVYFFAHHHIGKRVTTFFVNQKTIRNFFIIGCIVGLIGTGFSVYRLKKEQNDLLYRIQTKAKIKAEDAINQINYYLFEIKGIVDSLTDDLSKGRLQGDELASRMLLEMKENTYLFGISVALTPEGEDDDVRVANLTRFGSQVIDTAYQIQNVNGTPSDDQWYFETIETNKSEWFDPIDIAATGNQAVAYVKPFYSPQDTEKKKPIGVVRALLNLNTINVITSALALGQTGYSFLITKTGMYLYHPVEDYVRNHKTIFDISREKEDDNLRIIGKKAIEGESRFYSYKDTKEKRTLWTYYSPIPSSNWSLGVTFAENEISLPELTMRHRSIVILMWLIFALLCAFLFLFRIEQGSLRSIRLACIAMSILFLAGMCVLWYIVRTGGIIQDDLRDPITNQVAINAYMIEAQQRRVQAEEPPLIALPTGLYVYSIDTTRPNYLSFSGYVWQTIPKDILQKIEPGIRVPQATEVEQKLMYEKETEYTKTFGWRVNATLYQQYDYSEFPFDILNARIPLEPKDIGKPLILVPDISGYEFMQPSKLPGIHGFVELPGFTLEQSFFTMIEEQRTTSLGFSQKNSSKTSVLAFNVIFRRNLLNAFIIYFLPLMIILISMFVILIIQKSSSDDPFKSIGSYTALFFSVVVLQRSLRDQYVTGDVLYIEYFFFFTYITILLLVLYSLLEYMKSKNKFIQEKVLPVFRLMFWPIELALWFITTVIIFYN